MAVNRDVTGRATIPRRHMVGPFVLGMVKCLIVASKKIVQVFNEVGDNVINNT